MTDERTYTVEQADALLEELRERLVRVREARAVMFDAARLVDERTKDDGGGTAASPEYWSAQATLKDEVAWLAERDIALRDPQTGLVDFPGEREGRRVWLCWQLGEDRVGFWHELETGFIGRRPL
jgi:hypothetical protein